MTSSDSVPALLCQRDKARERAELRFSEILRHPPRAQPLRGASLYARLLEETGFHRSGRYQLSIGRGASSAGHPPVELRRDDRAGRLIERLGQGRLQALHRATLGEGFAEEPREDGARRRGGGRARLGVLGRSLAGGEGAGERSCGLIEPAAQLWPEKARAAYRVGPRSGPSRERLRSSSSRRRSSSSRASRAAASCSFR